MTDKPTPTDAELDAVIAEYQTRIYPQDMHPRFERAIMRAAITKWGQPARQEVRKPVAWYEYNADLDSWFLAYGHNPKAKTRPLVFGDTSPQPPQEPLTDEQIDTAWRSVDYKQPYDSFRIAVARAIESAHGIKGGQQCAD